VTPHAPRLARLIEALRRLPGVGPKSAQRMAFHLLSRDRDGAAHLAGALSEALSGLSRCPSCRMYCEGDCDYCSPRRRASGQLCVVESPADLIALDRSAAYAGRYFVLMGRLSPLDGIGPEELGLDALDALLRSGDIRELILALNPSVEGQATAHYLAEMGRRAGVAISGIAHGVPMGGELEFVDGGTLAHAFKQRQPLSS
jgi:recombination protein RecR